MSPVLKDLLTNTVNVELSIHSCGEASMMTAIDSLQVLCCPGNKWVCCSVVEPDSVVLLSHVFRSRNPPPSFVCVAHLQVRAEASAANKGHSILPDEAMREVFLNISQIYFVNSQLLRDLDDRMKIW